MTSSINVNLTKVIITLKINLIKVIIRKDSHNIKFTLEEKYRTENPGRIPY